MMRRLVQRVLMGAYRIPALRQVLGGAAFGPAYRAYKAMAEAPGAAALRPYLPAGVWAVDVGANIGFFTERFAAWADGEGKVLALEPEAANFERLNRRLRAKGLDAKVVAKCAAVGDRDGTARLRLNPDHPGDHRLDSEGDVEVPVRRIDTLLAELGDPLVGLIKIDVQGAEMQVLAGAAATITRCRPAIFIEVDDGALRGQGGSAAELLSWLEDRGYRFFTRRSGAMRPADSAHIADAASGPGAYLDVLALPRGSEI